MFKNILWDFIGKFSVQLVAFGISVLLTRLLSPSEFGVMGMAMVIIAFAHVFLDLGFNRAIIQQEVVSEIQYSTVFYINTAAAVFLTVVCYFAAAPLSQFYNQPLIEPVFKVLSVSFLINGLNLVPAALLYKQLRLKLNSILTLIATLISGVTGVILAYQGYGVWSLVYQSLLNSVLILILNFAYARWFPTLAFSLYSIKPLWQYGSRMFASGLLDNLYVRLDTFIIGKLFNTAVLGYYTRAQSMDNFVRQFSVNSIMGALFPYIAKHKNDRLYLNDLYQRYLHIICMASIALSGILFLISKFLFVFLFTEKWLYAAELFQLMSVIGFAWPVSSLMCNVIAGVGNSKAFFRLELFKKGLFLPVYIFGFIFGLKGFIYCLIAANVIGVLLNAFFVSKEIEISTWAQLKVITVYLLVGLLSVIFSKVLFFDTSNNILNMVVLATLFNASFFTLCFLFKLKAFKEISVVYKKLIPSGK